MCQSAVIMMIDISTASTPQNREVIVVIVVAQMLLLLQLLLLVVFASQADSLELEIRGVMMLPG